MFTRLRLFIFIFSFLSFIISFSYRGRHEGYEFIFLLPIVYMFGVFLIMSVSNKNKINSSKITFLGFLLMGMIRLVIMPVLISMSQVDPGLPYINPQSTYISESILLICYEWLLISFFLTYYFSRDKINVKHNNLNIKGNRIVYYLFLIVFIVVFAFYGINSPYINFGYISVNNQSFQRLGDESSSINILLQQTIQIGLALTFLLTLKSFSEKYKKTSGKIYFYLPVFVSLLILMIIVGERRTNQIYLLLIFSYLLVKFYPNMKRRIIIFLGSVGFIVIAIMSVYKFGYAFKYGSYTEAILNSSFSYDQISSMFQIYFFGPENVAVALQFATENNLSILNLIFDFFRSTFGINFLFKESEIVLTSQQFNTYIYGYERSTGQVLSGIGYSYIYFGAILTPFISLFNISISLFVEKLLNNTKSLEFSYLLLFILYRFCTNLFVATPALISLSTIMLGTAGTLFIVAIILGNRRYVI